MKKFNIDNGNEIIGTLELKEDVEEYLNDLTTKLKRKSWSFEPSFYVEPGTEKLKIFGISLVLHPCKRKEMVK